MFGQVRDGDGLLTVDGDDCTTLNAIKVSKLISLKSEKPARVLVMNTLDNRIESNRIESNQIKSNQIKSNQIKSNRIESNRIESNQIESNRIESNRIIQRQQQQCNILPSIPRCYVIPYRLQSEASSHSSSMAGTCRDHTREYEGCTAATSPAIVWLAQRIGGAPAVIMSGSTRIVPPSHTPNTLLPPCLDDDDCGIKIRNTLLMWSRIRRLPCCSYSCCW